jgi:hypothetical protein
VFKQDAKKTPGLSMQTEKLNKTMQKEQLQSGKLKMKLDVRAAARAARHAAAVQRRAGLKAESQRQRNKLMAPAKLASGIGKARVRKK